MKKVILALIFVASGAQFASAKTADKMTLKLRTAKLTDSSNLSKKQLLNPKRGLVVNKKNATLAQAFIASDEYKDQDFSRLDQEVELLK